MGFSGNPVVRTLHFTAMGPGFIPGQGTKLQQAMWHGQKKKTSEFTKTFLVH